MNTVIYLEERNKSITNEIKGKAEKSYYRTDIYTMQRKGDDIAIWTEEGTKRVRKYFLTTYLKEAYAPYLESCEEDDDKCSILYIL